MTLVIVDEYIKNLQLIESFIVGSQTGAIKIPKTVTEDYHIMQIAH